ncbi:type II CAAX endopeptidase family protein [Cytobacillus sp. S13-E01]|uniref:CPBP family intramembrane glutamic endopeptidase n=1 Tax=Cytobacillus sp. S13-E01 TaxID=3031326 RepID=UPI0023D8B774|nr:type II CAAX endopeptidase family protein [Cytobacillus sp. S13-E01]MDF0728715.1 type II CAAX endopeptidase family protein [Cytobacillus sp. S13-E01]
MEKRYWYVILTYIIMQLSSLIGIPILLFLGVGSGEAEYRQSFTIASTYWLIISFFVALLIILYLLRNDMKDRHIYDKRSSRASAAYWAIGGIFIALFAQVIAANIEISVFGIDPGSENTKQIIELVRVTPLLILVTSVIGPILEEIIFRKIIFGSFYKRFNYWISALASSIIFALVHMEPEHILLYSAMGFTFAFLYVKTGRLIVPIFAHVAMNTLVVVFQTIFADDIERIMKEAEQMQSFISFLL